jgi:transposase InsO family protein
MRTKKKDKGKPRTKRKRAAGRRRPRKCTFELRLAVVRTAERKGATQEEIGRAFGVSAAAVHKWLAVYRRKGEDGLRDKPRTRPRRKTPDPRKEAVVRKRKANPQWGTRRIRDELARTETIGVSETEVRRMLHEEELIPPREVSGPREHPPRRFERAEPNQLWQSDIFTFLLRRQERLYLTAFLDDCSRYVVSYAMAHHQRSGLVMEALARGLAEYGAPREILTDQGRQYTAWRGETEFEQELRRQGIRHVKSRPQHPQTVGKTERFWKTLWDEFLSRTVFADYADCDRRLALFVQYYNFQRPHQGIEGLVPADRFFRAAPQVRAAIEGAVTANALRLAHEQPVRKPFYLVGRLGDRDLTIAAAGGRVTVQMGDGTTETIDLTKEHDDEPQASSRVTDERSEEPETEPLAADAAVADDEGGPRRDGAAALPDGALGALGGEAGDRGDRRGAAVTRDVLPAGDEGAERDAGGAGAGGGRGLLDGGDGDGAEDRGAGGEGEEAGAGEAADGPALVPDEEGGEAWADDDGGGAAAGDADVAECDARWAEIFAALEEQGGEAGGDYDSLSIERFDPDDGWRGRVLTWERKLAGAEASSEDPDEEAQPDDPQDLRTGPDGAVGDGGALRDAAGGDERGALGERGGAAAGGVAQPLPDAAAPQPAWDARGDDAEAGGPAGDAAEGGGAGDGEREAAAGEREAPGAGRDDRSPPRGGGGPAEGSDHPVGATDASPVGDEAGGELR